LRTGDLIVALDNRPVGGTLGLEIALRNLSAPVVLNVHRGTESLTLTLAPRP
jgi:S1-C subfamily serine protease